jgi:hypothetical protein
MLTDIIVILLLSRKERCIENEEQKMSDQKFLLLAYCMFSWVRYQQYKQEVDKQVKPSYKVYSDPQVMSINYIPIPKSD